MCVAGFSQPRAAKFVPAHWSEEHQGLYFNGYSQAYTDGFFATETQSPVTIDIAIKPDFSIRNFGVILEISDYTRDHRIVVGQWKTSLVVLDSNDYSNSLRLPKIYASIAENADKAFNIRIRSNQKGTQVHINGKLQGSNRNLVLALPTPPQSSRLILGNDASAGNPWRGTVQSLSLYNKYLPVNADAPPELRYQFSAENIELVPDLSPNKVDLKIPSKAVIFKKNILELPSMQDIKEPWLWLDTVINFIGFMPFGLLLAMLLLGRITKAKSVVAITTCCAFLFSLCIEISQVLMPERTSSLADLLINTAGGFCGALLFIAYHKYNFRNTNISVSS